MASKNSKSEPASEDAQKPHLSKAPASPPLKKDLSIKPQRTTMETHATGVGVIDKAAAILTALEAGPATLNQLVEFTGLPRPTIHRLSLALVHYRILGRESGNRFVLGSRIKELAISVGEDRIGSAAGSILSDLRDATGESAQIFRRQGKYRLCVATAERTMGLLDTIPVGAQLSMLAGSAAQVLLAWESPQKILKGLVGARFTPTTLSKVKTQGWAQSTGEREPGIASVSAPIFDSKNNVIAAVSISGPIERMGKNPGLEYHDDLLEAAEKLTAEFSETSQNHSIAF